MTDHFRADPEDLRDLQVGPIAPYLECFANLISQQGYCKANGWPKVLLVSDLSRWLQWRRITLKELDETQTTAFLNARWKRVARRAGDQATMTLLLRCLRQAEVLAARAAAGSDIDLIASDYESFLLGERSLMSSSTQAYLAVARRFLSHRFPSGKVYLAKLRAKHVADFVLEDTSNRGRRSAQLMATVLRSFLGFLFQKRRTVTNLAAAVPTVPNRRLAELPRYLEAAEVEKVLGSCDRRRKVGKRDYAILLLLARLGLRAGEVAHLTLDDINWRAGELLVRGKGARADRLPLVHNMGQALVS